MDFGLGHTPALNPGCFFPGTSYTFLVRTVSGIVVLAALLVAGCGPKPSSQTVPPKTSDAAVADASTTTSADPNASPTQTNVGAIGQDKLSQTPPPQTNNNNPSVGQVLGAPVAYLQGLSNGKARAIATVDIASLNQAIQMFKVDQDRYPKDLNELIRSGLISKIPDPPYQMKIVYDPDAGQVSVVPADE